MIPKKLTIVERQILANQYRILEIINEDREDYSTKAEILERGFTGRYSDVFMVNQEEVPEEVCNETNEILSMYRRINNAIGHLTEEEKETIALEKLKFEGFDANNDSHYHYMTFMVENMDLWQEHKDSYLNSHGTFPLSKV